MNKEQIIALAKGIGMEDGGADLLQGQFIGAITTTWLEKFANAAIESYKAELLKGVGEPNIWFRQSEFDDAKVKRQSFNGWRIKYSDLDGCLFTSDQVAAAIAKEMKQKEGEVAEWKAKAHEAADQLVSFVHGAHSELATERDELRDQLAAAQEEIERLSSLCDKWNTECDEYREENKRVSDQLAKAEQPVTEWQPIETAPSDRPLLVARIEGDSIFWVTDAKKSRIGFWSTLNGRAVNEPTHWCEWRKFLKGE